MDKKFAILVTTSDLKALTAQHAVEWVTGRKCELKELALVLPDGKEVWPEPVGDPPTGFARLTRGCGRVLDHFDVEENGVGWFDELWMKLQWLDPNFDLNRHKAYGWVNCAWIPLEEWAKQRRTVNPALPAETA